MRKKEDLKGKQRTPTTVTSSSSSAGLEQQVREHPVVQEVIRLFDARIITIVRTGANEADRSSEVEQPALFFSS